MKHVRNRDSKQNFKNGYLKRSARFKTVVQSNQNKFKCESEREGKKKKKTVSGRRTYFRFYKHRKGNKISGMTFSSKSDKL